MDCPIDHARAVARHSEETRHLLEEMTRRLQKAVCPVPGADEMTWSYIWCVGIGNGRARIDSVFPSLALSLGRRHIRAPLFASPDDPMPADALPPEIFSAMCPARRAKVNPATYPHVASFLIDNPNRPRQGVEPALATGGYRSKKGLFIFHVQPGDDIHPDTGRATEILLRIDGKNAHWSGGLVPKARDRFDATPEGIVFRYRNHPLTRLTAAEIQDLVGGRTFRLAFP